MPFVILAKDYTDDAALDRRMAARDAHLALSDEAVKRGEQLMGAAMLDADGKMVGSTMVVDFPTRADVDAWLAEEPYVTGNVWESIEVLSCNIGPSFVKQAE